MGGVDLQPWFKRRKRMRHADLESHFFSHSKQRHFKTHGGVVEGVNDLQVVCPMRKAISQRPRAPFKIESMSGIRHLGRRACIKASRLHVLSITRILAFTSAFMSGTLAAAVLTGSKATSL